MGLGAVVAISANRRESIVDNTAGSLASQAAGLCEGLAWVEVCGRSLVERIVERFVAIDVDRVSVLVEAGAGLPSFRLNNDKVTVQVVGDLHLSIARTVQEHAHLGIDHSFISWGDTYTETDLLDLFSFHREARQAITPTYCKEGGLALWVVNCDKAQQASLANLLEVGARGSRYFIREYVNCLSHPRDLRSLASDMLRGRCETGPSGRQIRRGVWVDEGAEVHRRARLVAPAYIGRGAKVRADVLITRLSNIEKECCVDCGTVIEDSSILADTTVGMCLDLCHAVVNGNQLLNLERDVLVEICDAAVLHSTSASRTSPARIKQPSLSIEPSAPREKSVPSPKLNPMPNNWQWDENLIQE